MMKRVFETDKGRILGLYSKNAGVVFAELPGTEHIAHVTWLKPGAKTEEQTSNIDYFLVTDPFLEATESVRPVEVAYPYNVEKVFGISYEIAAGKKRLAETIRDITKYDIFRHVEKRQLPDARRPTMTMIVPEITSHAVMNPFRHANVQTGGKADFYPSCILHLNLDFAPFCINGITPDGKLAPKNTCFPCYAARQHSNYPNTYFVERDELVHRIQMGMLERSEKGLPTKYMRFGKRTEAGDELFLDHIVTALEAAEITEISVVFPTKNLEFDPYIAELLKRTDSTLLFSLGDDRIEPGAVARGHSNESRILHTHLYEDAGVRTVPYAMIDPTQKDGGFFRKIVAEALKFQQAQFLPLRLYDRALARIVIGGWDQAIGPRRKDLLGEEVGGWEQEENNSLVHACVHPDLEKMIGDNTGDVGMCAHNCSTEWCNKCFMPGETGEIVPRVKTRPDDLRPPKGNQMRRKKIGDPDDGQMDLLESQDK